LKTILFVCTGNTCRSSMAEAIFKDRIRNLNLDIEVISAGTAVFRKSKASNHAIHVMDEKGIDLSSHRSRAVSPEMIDRADLILTMTQEHKKAVLEIAPRAAEKVFTLKEYTLERESDNNIEYCILELMEKMNQKRNAFLEKHKSFLLELKTKQKKLLEELQNVEKEIKEWEKQMDKEIKEEKKELEKLQAQLPGLDIPDPFGGPVQYYRECAEEIEGAVDKLIIKLTHDMDKK